MLIGLFDPKFTLPLMSSFAYIVNSHDSFKLQYSLVEESAFLLDRIIGIF